MTTVQIVKDFAIPKEITSYKLISQLGVTGVALSLVVPISPFRSSSSSPVFSVLRGRRVLVLVFGPIGRKHLRKENEISKVIRPQQQQKQQQQQQ